MAKLSHRLVPDWIFPRHSTKNGKNQGLSSAEMKGKNFLKTLKVTKLQNVNNKIKT